MWVDQVKFELKCIPRYLTVRSRDNALDEGERELGGSVFGIKKAFGTFSLVLREVRGQHSRSKDNGDLHPTLLDQNICCKNYKARNCQHTLAVCCDGTWGSQCARRIEWEKERLPVEHPRCCTGMNSTDRLGILVVTCWWTRKATIELAKMELQGSRVYQGFVSVGWY